MRRTGWLAVIILLLGLVSSAMAQSDSKPRPRVAILPIQNVSGEKWKELKIRQNEKTQDYTEGEFAKRGFEVLTRKDIEFALAEMKIDLSDEENHRRAVLFEVGKQLKVDFILLAVITDTDQKKQDRMFYQDIEGNATVKLWLLDVAAEKPVLSAQTVVGRSGGARVSLGKGSDRQVQAPSNAVRDALKEFFRGYPVLSEKGTS